MTTQQLTVDDLTNLTANRIDIIQTLARHGPQTPKQVSDRIGKSRSTVRNALRRLRNRNWVEYTDPDQGEQQLTDKGLVVGSILEDHLAAYHTTSE